MTVLEPSESLSFPIADSQDEIARSTCSLQPVYTLIEACIELKNIPENKGKGVSNSRLLSKSFIFEVYSNFWDCHLLIIHSRYNSEPPHKSYINPVVSILLGARMVYNNQGVFPIRTCKIPIERSQLNCLSAYSCITPSSKHWARSFSKLANHVDSSQSFVRGTRTVSNSFHFLIVSFVGVHPGGIVCQIKSQPNNLRTRLSSHPFGNIGREVLFHLLNNICPCLLHKRIELFFQQNTMS